MSGGTFSGFIFFSSIHPTPTPTNNCYRNTKSPSIPFVGADSLDCDVLDSELATAHASAQGRASVGVEITVQSMLAELSRPYIRLFSSDLRHSTGPPSPAPRRVRRQLWGKAAAQLGLRRAGPLTSPWKGRPLTPLGAGLASREGSAPGRALQLLPRPKEGGELYGLRTLDPHLPTHLPIWVMDAVCTQRERGTGPLQAQTVSGATCLQL